MSSTRIREAIEKTSKALAELVIDAVPTRMASRQRIHPATRVFMALRIAVNRELEVLAGFLEKILAHLNPGGRLCILSFHSLEDRMVKRSMQKWLKGCSCPPGLPVCVCGGKPLARKITSKPLRPSDQEVAENPMARSTRLRAVEKI